MLSYPRAKLLILVMATSLPVISSECRESYATVCDTFDDFVNYTDRENLSDLIIGSVNGTPNMTSVHLMNTLQLQRYPKLTSLVVIRAVNNLESTYAYQCTYYSSDLKYVTFYGNELKTIEAYNFPVLRLKKMSLVNNKIKNVKGRAFRPQDIEEIDLSDNFLEVIETDALPLSKATKTITIRNNKLTHIEPGSFPPTLQALNLDKNRLRYIQDEAFQDLVALKELTLSHNKLNDIPKINHMKELVVFDISFNSVSTINKEAFNGMENLKFLDLSNNAISNSDIIESLQTPMKQPEFTVSLVLNRLRGLNLTNVNLEGKTFYLYGNPWNCDVWPQLKKQLEGHESKCDKEFLSTGNVPYCINYRQDPYPFSSLWERDIDRFHDSVRSSEEKAACELKPMKSRWLKPSSYGCVA